MASRLLTFAVWALVAASGLFWGLRLSAQPAPLPAHAQVPSMALAPGGEWPRVLGVVADADDGASEPAPTDGRFRLLGVVAPSGAQGSGLALISVGGEPAKVWRTGAVVEGQTVLLGVGRRSAQLGPRGGTATMELNLPEPLVATRSAALPMSGAPAPRPARVPGMGPGTAPAPGAKPAEPDAASEDDEE